MSKRSPVAPRFALVLGLLGTSALSACGGAAAAAVELEPRDTHVRAARTSGDETAAPTRTRTATALFAATREFDPDEAVFFGRLVALTSRLRGLAPIHPIVTRVASSRVISEHLVSTIEDDDIVDLVDLYVALGMLEPGTDVVAVLARVVDEQVVGFYDPELDVLVLRDDVITSLASGRSADAAALVTIAHEVIHALQAQHLDLRDRMDREQDTDASDAYQALVEGDATLGMLVVAAQVGNVPLSQVLEGVSAELDFAGTGASGAGSEELASAPPIIRIGMTAPYIAGLRFCATLFESGGYAAVDGAHVRLPVSTEQVMHPAKYLRDERPHRVALGELATLEAAGYERIRDDTLGELELAIYLGRGGTGGIDVVAGEGWGGDRVALFRRGPALAAVLAASFDTEADAREAEIAARRSDSLDRGRILVREGRVVMTAHGLDASFTESLRARAAEIARTLPAESPP